MIKRYTYQSGEARDINTFKYGVEYMLMLADVDGDEIEIYAEKGPENEEDYQECMYFDELKAEIISAASEYGIDLSNFDFDTDILF